MPTDNDSSPTTSGVSHENQAAEAERQRADPLAHRDLGQDLVAQVRGAPSREAPAKLRASSRTNQYPRGIAGLHEREARVLARVRDKPVSIRHHGILMKLAPIPEREIERLAALHSYEVLDTPAEQMFDDLARLAALILAAPIALVSIVDERRQWFKARFGLTAPETPRDISFCGHVVAGESPLIVTNAPNDARFADNPLVTGELAIRFYAGMPLRTTDGFVLGTLCAIDTVEREPSAAQLDGLRLLARQTMDQLEARRTRLELSRARAAAETMASRLEGILDAMADGVTVETPEGEVVAYNVAAQRLLGFEGDGLRGRRWFDGQTVIAETGKPISADRGPTATVVSTGSAVRNLVLGLRRQNAATTWVNVNSLPQRDRDGRVFEVVTTLHDITAMRAAAERASQQERLAITGTLAAGIGHEINNPLAYVIGNLDFSMEELREIAGPSPSARLRELLAVLTEAREGADRIRKIVRGLRTLAREDVTLNGVDLRAAVETALGIAAHELRRRATVSVDVSAMPLVQADESRLTQVLVNLVVNAAQAFEVPNPSTNRIDISGTTRADGRVAITVRDNGPGIPAELRERIFDPFFTTKPVGTGTGLGLSVSRTIVGMLGGELTVESVEGQGATFEVVLPVATPGPTDGGESAQTAAPAVRGRVLLVDDDVAVLNAVRRLLSREHEVVACSDPREALGLLERGERFDLVVCDLMMPYLSGEELYAAVARVRPAMAERFVFVTGGANHPSVSAFLARIPNERMEKPFVPQNLLGIARRLAATGRDE